MSEYFLNLTRLEFALLASNYYPFITFPDAPDDVCSVHVDFYHPLYPEIIAEVVDETLGKKLRTLSEVDMEKLDEELNVCECQKLGSTIDEFFRYSSSQERETLEKLVATYEQEEEQEQEYHRVKMVRFLAKSLQSAICG